MSAIFVSVASRAATAAELSAHASSPNLRVESLSNVREPWVLPGPSRVRASSAYLEILTSSDMPRLAVTLGGGADSPSDAPPSWRALAPHESPARHEVVAYAPPVGAALDSMIRALSAAAAYNAQDAAVETLSAYAPATRAAHAAARCFKLIENLFCRSKSSPIAPGAALSSGLVDVRGARPGSLAPEVLMSVLADDDWRRIAAERAAAAPAVARIATRDAARAWLVSTLDDIDYNSLSSATPIAESDAAVSNVFSRLLRSDYRGAADCALASGRPRLAALAVAAPSDPTARALAASTVSPAGTSTVNACLALISGLTQHVDVTSRLTSWPQALAAHDLFGAAPHASLASSLARFASAATAGFVPLPEPWWGKPRRLPREMSDNGMLQVYARDAAESTPSAGDDAEALDAVSHLLSKCSSIDASFSVLALAAFANGGSGLSRSGKLAREALASLLDARAHSPDSFEAIMPFLLAVMFSALSSPTHSASASNEEMSARSRAASVLGGAVNEVAGGSAADCNDFIVDAARLLTPSDGAALLDLLSPRETCGARTLASRLPCVSPSTTLRAARNAAAALESDGAWHLSILVLQCAAGALLVSAAPAQGAAPSDSSMEKLIVSDSAGVVAGVSAAATAAADCLRAARSILERHIPAVNDLCAAALSGANRGLGLPVDAEIDFSGAAPMLHFPELTSAVDGSGQMNAPPAFTALLNFILTRGIPRAWIPSSLALRAIADASRMRRESLAVALPALYALSILDDDEAAALRASGAAMTRETACMRIVTILSTIVAPTVLLSNRAIAREMTLARARTQEVLSACASGTDADTSARRIAAAASSLPVEKHLIVLSGLCSGGTLRSATIGGSRSLSPYLSAPLPARWPIDASSIIAALDAIMSRQTRLATVHPLPIWLLRARAMRSLAAASTSGDHLAEGDTETLRAWHQVVSKKMKFALEADAGKMRLQRAGCRSRTAGGKSTRDSPGVPLSSRRAARANGAHRVLAPGDFPALDEILVFVPLGANETEIDAAVFSELAVVASGVPNDCAAAPQTHDFFTWPPAASGPWSTVSHDDAVLASLIDDVLEWGPSQF